MKEEDRRTTAPPKVWGGVPFYVYRTGILRYERRNDADTVRISSVKGSYRVRFRRPLEKDFHFVMDRKGVNPQKFMKNETAAVAGLAAAASEITQPSKTVPDDGRGKAKPFDLADVIASKLTEGDGAHYQVSRGITTTGSAALLVSHAGFEYNVVITKNRYQKR